MKNIIVLGYYNRKNLGDDYFKNVFNKIFEGHIIYFYDPNKIEVLPSSTDILICGGGDIITDYFTTPIIKLKYEYEKNNNKKLPTFAVSIGITFPNQITENNPYFLDIFDHIIVRSKHDYNLLTPRYNNISYLPDAVFIDKQHNIFSYIFNSNYFITNNVVGVMLARPIYNFGKNENYNLVMEQIINCLKFILDSGYDIHLVPFNTDKLSDNDNDMIICNDVAKELNSSKVHIKRYTLGNINKAFSEYKFAICMRFHSHVIAINNNIPFISLCTTPKVKYLMNDLNLNHLVIDIKKTDSIYTNFIDIFQNLENSDTTLPNVRVCANDFSSKITTLKSAGPYYVTNDMIETIFNNCSTTLCKYIKNKYHDVNFDDMINDIKIMTISEFNAKYLKNELNNDIFDIIDYTITGNNKSEYHHGISQNIHVNFRDSVIWITKHMFYNGTYKSKSFHNFRTLHNKNSVNMDFIVQHDLGGYHRSGWKYVVDNLYTTFNNKNADLVLDAYCDRTFLWDKQLFINVGILPYVRPWIGFLHHTPDNTNDNNLTKIVNDPIFLKSLNYCRGLFVMSNYLKKYLEPILPVKIFVIYHPTEMNVPKFTFDKFKKNNYKKIIQIGGWLRESYSIYKLPINNKMLDITKCALKGKDMNNYFKPENITFETILGYDGKSNICGYTPDNLLKNRYIIGLLQHLVECNNSVQIIEKLNNDDFDILLTKNIVFLNLIDASACNTLIECVTRNTPIIINKIPAVIEILGEDYPLYYDNIAEAGQLATNIDKLYNAYNYLTELDKTDLNINTFLKKFNYYLGEL